MAFRLLVLRRLGSVTPAVAVSLESLGARGGALACATLVAAAPARLWWQARGLVDSDDAALPMARGVLQTTWGTGLELQVALGLLALAGLVLVLRPRRPAWRPAGFLVTAFAIAGLAFTPAMMGHAIARERLTVLSVLCDGLHVTAAGAWVGSLLFLTLASRALRAEPGGDRTVAELIATFHPVALGSAGLLVASGTGNLFLRVEHLRDLFGSAYGTLFLVKLGLTAVVLSLGAYHSRTAARRARAGGVAAVTRSLSTEAAFAALTIAVTALLSGTSPPMT